MKFVNQVVCDLRAYNSPETAGQIKSITNAALVILPKDADEQTRAAFAKIKMRNIASTVYCDTQAEIHQCNGDTILQNGNVPDGESMYVINGKARIMPLSEEKHVSLIINGDVLYDEGNAHVQLLTVNGKARPIDFRHSEILPDEAILTVERFVGEGEHAYCAESIAVVQAVPPEARGKLHADVILAHPSVQKSQIVLDADTIWYAEDLDNVIFRKNSNKFTLTRSLLQDLPGKLVVANIGTLYIDKAVDAALLREKMLMLLRVGKVHAPKAARDTVQMLCCQVGSVGR